MNKLLFIAILFLSCQAYAQTSEKYNSEYANFYRAEELFEKEQYGAARKEFRIFMDGFPEVNDPMYIKASYYEAISALNLYNNDAERSWYVSRGAFAPVTRTNLNRFGTT